MFKYLISILLLIASACSCSTSKQDNSAVCGGYGNETKVRSEDMAVWNEAIAARPDLKDVTPEQRVTLDKLTDLLEDDEDVTHVYSTLKPAEE